MGSRGGLGIVDDNLATFELFHPPIPQTNPLVLVGLDNPAVFGHTYTLSVTGGNTNGAVTFVLDPSSTPCTLTAGSQLTQLTVNKGTGTCTVTANMAGNITFLPISVTVTVKLAPATPTINVIGYNVTYDGKTHTATGTATGVKGEDLSSELNLPPTHTLAGTYTDTWSFHDVAGNYADASGTVTDTISKANATITVTGYNVQFDGSAHTASGTATGVLGENLISGLNLAGTTHTSAGTYTDTWTFTDTTGNYNNASGNVTDIIVGYTFIGFITPLKPYPPAQYSGVFNLGKAVPIKWQLKNSSGAFLTQLTTTSILKVFFNSAGTAKTCPVLPTTGTPFTLYTGNNGVTGNSTFRYDTTNNQFIFNWDTTSVAVAPFGAGCYTLVLQLADGSTKITSLQLTTTTK